MDNAGNTTAYKYNQRTGQIEGTRLPKREVGLDVDLDKNVLFGETEKTAVYNPEGVLEDAITQDSVTVDYIYDTRDRLIGVSQGLASEEGAANSSRRSVSYTYGEFDDLTAIHHNGFSYGFTYDEFGNVLTTSIAGQVISTNVYGANNGQLKQTIRADGTVLENTYDLYGRITESKVGGQVTNSYTFDNDGNLAKHLDKVANLTNTYDYNDSNKVVRSEVYSGNSTATKDLESRMQYTYTKSGLVGTLSYEEQGDEVKTYKYTYAADELPTKSTHPDTSVTAWTYDSLRRNSKTIFTPKDGAADAKKLYTTLSYAEGHAPVESGRTDTTTLVDTYTNKFGSSGKAVSEFTYKYDGWGNITKITDVAGKTRTYSYNDFSEVTEAVETYGNGSTSTYKYSYDAGGNILTETVNGKVNSYVYDSVWKDKLISYNGKAITYDEAGHPLNYMGSAMTWDVNDRLTSISGKTANGTASNISYTYLSDGSRRSKTVDGVTTTYHYNNGLLLSQSTGDETLHFYYDSTGKVVSLGYQKGSAAEVGYFFARNAQGDIIAVYRSSDSKLMGTYEYDLWGKPISTIEATAGIDTNDVLTKNPFRYRGYYFDEETGFYYLQSRYYDSVIRRFISADSVIAGVGSSVIGHNLFGYCFNDSVNMCDPSGYWPQWVKEKYTWSTWLTETTVSTGSVTKTDASITATGPSITSKTTLGPYSQKVSISKGYATAAVRGQTEVKENLSVSGTVGAFGKASVKNYTKEDLIGSKTGGIGRKLVYDEGVVSGKLGVKWEGGFGLAKGIKPSLASVRDTYCIYLPTCQIEIGTSMSFITVGNVSERGALMEGGYGAEGDLGKGGWYNGGFIFRITPQTPQ